MKKTKNARTSENVQQVYFGVILFPQRFKFIRYLHLGAFSLSLSLSLPFFAPILKALEFAVRRICAVFASL